jgi:hypothetical protein
MEFPPLKRSGMAGNLPRGMSTPAVTCPLQVFSTSWGFTPGPCRRTVCFTRPALLGFRLPGACASGAAHLSVSYLPSCRYFSALFPSEEWKTTGSSAFRALLPLRVGMPFVHGRSPERKNILAPA